ncbi:hypothetical protein BDF14DRAFT_1832404 [Spinellus fusiger]|nr:hypothetical protein BDF14DRAFT_1832404 [Spinellus fusiger]
MLKSVLIPVFALASIASAAVAAIADDRLGLAIRITDPTHASRWTGGKNYTVSWKANAAGKKLFDNVTGQLRLYQVSPADEVVDFNGANNFTFPISQGSAEVNFPRGLHLYGACYFKLFAEDAYNNIPIALSEPFLILSS